MKKLLNLLGALLALFVALWVSAHVFLRLKGPVWIERIVEQKTGLVIHISDIQSHFLTTIEFHDIELSQPVVMTVPRLVVSLHPSVFPLRFTLYEPKIRWALSEKSSSARPPLPPFPIPVQIEVVNADIAISTLKQSWHVLSVNGTGRLSALAYDAQVSGVSPTLGKFEAKVALDQRLERPWRASVFVPSVKIQSLAAEKIVPSEKLEGFSGLVQLKGQASGTWLDVKSPVVWSVDVAAKGLRYTRADDAVVGPVRGTATLNAKGIENIDVALQGVHVKGAVRSAWADPKLDLTARVPDQTSITELLRGMGLARMAESFGGNVGALAQIKGAPTNPLISGSFNSEPVITHVQWPPLQGEFRYENQNLDLNADLLSGKLTVAGKLASSGPSTLQVGIEQLSLTQLARFNLWPNVRGNIDGKCELLVNSDVPVASGSFRFRQFQWGRLKTKPLLEGTFSVNDRKVQVKTNDRSLDVALSRTKNIWTIQKGRVELSSIANMDVTGRYNSADRTCDLDVAGENIPPDLWPPLVSRYPQVTGGVNFSGRMQGPLAALVTDAILELNKIQFGPNQKVWNGHAHVMGHGANWNIDEITIAPGYHAKVDLSAKPAFNLHVLAKLTQADPQLLFDLARSTTSIDGQLNATVELQWNGHDLVGFSSAAWSPGKIGNFGFSELNANARFEKQSIFLEEFSLVRGDQAIRGHAELTRRKQVWGILADTQFQNWGNQTMALNGETTVEGEAGFDPLFVDLRFTTPFLELNNVPLEEMVADAHYRGGKWTLNANAQDIVTAKLKGDFGDDSIRGSIQADDLDLKIYLPRLFPHLTEVPDGTANISLTLNGTLQNLDARLKFASTDLLWRREHIAPQFSASFSNGVLAFQDGSVELKQGGTIHFAGQIVAAAPGRPAVVDIHGDGKALSLQSVIHLATLPLNWNGRIDSTFKILSSSGHVNSTVAFNGKHDGFSAFEGNGRVYGELIGSDDEWDFSNLRVDTGDGYISALPNSKIYLQKDGSATMHLGVDVRNIRTGVLSFYGGLEVTGALKKIPAADPTQPPTSVTELEIFARSLWVNHYVLDGAITRLSIGHDELEFSPIPGSGQQMSGVLHYEHFPTMRLENFRLMDHSEEKIFWNGYVGADKWDFDLRAHHMSTDVLRSLLNSDLSLDGEVDVNVKGGGVPSDPVLSGHVIWRKGKLLFLPIDLAESDILYKDHYLSILNLNATKRNGFTVAGSARFYAGSDDTHELDPDVDLQVEKGDLSFLREVFPSVSRAHGTFSGRVRMLKKSWGTSIAGFFNMDKVSLSTSHVPDLEKGLLKITLDKNRLHIEEAKAQIGNGNLKLAGFVDFTDGLPSFYNLSLLTEGERGIKVRVPEYSTAAGPVLSKISLFRDRFAGASQGEALVNLILKGSADAPLLAGAITFENTAFTYPAGAKRSDEVEETNVGLSRTVEHFFDKLLWDVNVIAGHRTWYQNDLVDAMIQGDVQFKGPTHDLEIRGNIHTEQGAIVYSGNEFQIQNAALEIVTQGPLLNDASTKQTLVYLKATAEREVYYTDNLGNGVEDTIIMVVDRSLLGEFQPRFYAKNNPSLSPERALQLALGLPLSTPVDTENILPDQRNTAGSARTGTDVDAALRLGLIQLLDSSLASPLARTIARNTGLVDYIRVSFQEKDKFQETDPLLGSSSAEASSNITQNDFLKYAKGTKVKFGKGLSDRLFADYSFRVDQYQNQLDLRHEVELSYRLHRNLFLRGTSELDRERVLGRPPDRRAILENQWRFGLPRHPDVGTDNASTPYRRPT